MAFVDKGFRPFEKKVWLSSPTMHGEEQKFIQEAFDTNWVAPLGKNVNEFEKETMANLRTSSNCYRSVIAFLGNSL